MHRLPADLARALTLFDGVHLWADLADGRANFGIARLSEWEATSTRGLVISYHGNGDYELVLDTRKSVYRWVDHEDPDHEMIVGRSFAETLGWFWIYAQSLDPRAEEPAN